MEEILFELKQVHFSYLGKIPALCGVDLRIARGDKVGIIGANGTGKSTLLAMLDALLFPDRGTIRAFGRELRESVFGDADFSKSFRARVGFVFQNPDVQLFCPTVKDDIVFGPLQLGFGSETIKKRLDELVSTFSLAHLLERSPHQLSIGEKKKVAIASVLAIDPEILLLDEPTAGLDPQTTRDIIDNILTQNHSGRTVITATHDLHIIEEIADTIHVFGREKKIIRSASPYEIISDSAFLQEHNLVHVHRHRHKDKVHTHPHPHLEHHQEDNH